MSSNKLEKYCYALDLKDDDKLIKEYKEYHRSVWPEITTSIKEAGIKDLEIYLIANRLFMIMTVDDSFSFEQKASMDRNNPKVQEWETLMWTYQQALPCAKEGEKWMLMDKIFKLD